MPVFQAFWFILACGGGGFFMVECHHVARQWLFFPPPRAHLPDSYPTAARHLKACLRQIATNLTRNSAIRSRPQDITGPDNRNSRTGGRSLPRDGQLRRGGVPPSDTARWPLFHGATIRPRCAEGCHGLRNNRASQGRWLATADRYLFSWAGRTCTLRAMGSTMRGVWRMS